MKVLILPSWYLPEGGQFCKEQALRLNEAGIDVAILANVELSWKKYGFRAFTYPYGFNSCYEDGILTFRHYSFRVPRSEKLNQQKWIKSTLKQFESYVRHHGMPDIIHAHSSMWAGYVAFLIKHKYNVPYVITEHRGRFSAMSRPNIITFRDWYTPFLEKTFSNADYIIPVSSLQKDKIRVFSGLNNHIQVVSNIVDTDFFSLNIKEKKVCTQFTFFTANSFDDAKGYDILLRAFDLTCENYSDVRLVIAGRVLDHPVFRIFYDQCKHKEQIMFTGFLSKEKVREQLWLADAYVLASRTEAQPVSVLEALSVGLPVVCTEVVPKEILTKEVGFRCPVNDPHALSTAMQTMVKSESSFNRLNISEHLKGIASPEAVVSQLINIYNQILSELP